MHTVARGPVPRDRSTYAKTARRPKPFPVPIDAWRGTGPRPTVKGNALAYRSAGACPPRSFDPREKRTQTKAVFPTVAWRGTGPRPTVIGTFFHRSAGACPPRSHDLRENRTPTKAVFLIVAWRGTGPRPTVNGGGLIYRSAGACPPRSFDPRENRTPTKAVFRADRGMAREGPRPTVKGDGLIYRSVGACPPRSFDPRENRTPANRFPDRCPARDRPSPYGERRRPCIPLILQILIQTIGRAEDKRRYKSIFPDKTLDLKYVFLYNRLKLAEHRRARIRRN